MVPSVFFCFCLLLHIWLGQPSITSRRSCYLSLEILIFLDWSAEILFILKFKQDSFCFVWKISWSSWPEVYMPLPLNSSIGFEWRVLSVLFICKLPWISFTSSASFHSYRWFYRIHPIIYITGCFYFSANLTSFQYIIGITNTIPTTWILTRIC
jgi:hypothetical protein